MPRFKNKTSGGSYFKPDLRVDYKPTDGKFNVYDTRTQEKEERNSFAMYFVRFMYSFRDGDSYVSSKFEDYFGDNIVVRDADDFKYYGTFRYNRDTKCLQDINNTLPDLTGQTVLHVVGITENGDSVLLTISGITKLDLTVKEFTPDNSEKVKQFNECSYCKLVPSADTIVAGKGKKKKDIHLLELTDVKEVFDPKLDDRAVELNEEVEKEFANVQQSNDSESEEEVTPEDIADTFDWTPPY